MYSVRSAVVTVNPDADYAGHVLWLSELPACTVVIAALAASPKILLEEVIVGRSD
jgi:hypothetical protein